MKHIRLSLFLALISTAALAQKIDAAFAGGGSFASDINAVLRSALPPVSATPLTFKTANSIFLEATPAFRIVGGRAASLHVELPFAGILSQEVKAVEFPSLRNHLYALFLTPAANVRVLPSAPVSPWFSIGGGWARYGSAQNKGAVEYGGGLDIKTGISRLAVRAEVRDFVTGTPDPNVFFLISLLDSAARRHNILVGGGVVVRL